MVWGSRSERVVVIVAVVVVVGTIAVLATWSLDRKAPDQGRVGLDAADQYDSIDELAATRETVIERDGETLRTVARVRRRPHTGAERVAVRRSDRRQVDLRVSNGSVLWLYDAEENHVSIDRLDSRRGGETRGERIEELFRALNLSRYAVEGSASASVRGIQPLPVVPQRPGYRVDATASEGAFTVQYLGTAQVADQRTYVLKLSPENDTRTDGFTQTLWLDTDRFFPVQQVSRWRDDGGSTSVTTTYRNLTYDPDLSDATFRFEPPANATVEGSDEPHREYYPVVTALRADVNASRMTVPRPDAPDGFALTTISKTDGRVLSVSLGYENETASLSVSKYDFVYPAEDGDETVRIDNRTGQLTYGPTMDLSWECRGFRYTARGRNVAARTLIAFARSVGCE
ncbi:MAG: outer membrane lipoprotein carrier protein LolA [Haloarculaceae archaeon]